MSTETQDSFEYLTADTPENCKKIVDWIFSKEIDCPHLFPPIIIGNQYRRKKPQEYVVLTDQEEITRGLNAEVIEWRHTENGSRWITPFRIGSANITQHLENGVFRIKPGCKLPPKKVKRTRDRTREECSALIGIAFYRHIADRETWHILTSNDCQEQSYYEISQDRGAHWETMQITYEVEESCAG